MTLLILVCLLIELLQPDRHLSDRTSLLLIFKILILFGRIVFYPIALIQKFGVMALNPPQCYDVLREISLVVSQTRMQNQSIAP